MDEVNESTMSAMSGATQSVMRRGVRRSRRATVWILGAMLLLNSVALGRGLNTVAAGDQNLRETTMADEQQKEDPLEAEKRRTALLEEKAKQAEALKKIREAELSGTEVTPPEGKTEVDDKVKIEAEILTHEAMAEIAKAIAEDLRRAGVTRVTIHDEAVINAVLAYRAFQSQTKSYVDRYDRLLARDVPSELVAAPAGTPHSFALAAALADASAITKSIIGLAALFRTDVKVIGVETGVSEEALVAELVRQLNSGPGHVEVYYPAVFKPGILARNAVAESQTLKTLEPLYVRVDSAKQKLARLGLALEFLRQKIGTPDLPEAELRLALTQQADLQLWKEQLTDLNAEVKAFITGLTVADEKTGVDPFSQLVKTEGLIKLNDETARANHVLALRVEKSGGANVIKKNLFTHLFTGDRLTHTGGTIISYILFDQQGAIATSGTMFRNTPRTKNQRIGDNLARSRQGNEPVAQH